MSGPCGEGCLQPAAVKYWEDVGAIRWTVIPGLVGLVLVRTGTGSSGNHVDGDGHVLNDGGRPSPPVRGRVCAALTTAGTGYNSGFALARALTLAYLVSHELGPMV